MKKENYQEIITHILTAMFMNETNFLRTAIISEKFFEGISLRMASIESWIEGERKRKNGQDEVGMEGWIDKIKTKQIE